MSLVLPRHLTCQEIVELVTRYDEGDLDAADRGRFEEHLATCGACVTYHDQMLQTVEALGALDHDASGGGAPAGAPAEAPSDPSSEPPIDPLVELSLLSAFRGRLGPEAE